MTVRDLEGLRVAVTAGGGGIGFAIAGVLQARGARLAVCDVDPAVLAAADRALSPEVLTRADVADERDVDAFFDAIRDRLGGLDALVNNAGVAGPTGRIDTLDPADWRRCLEVCLTGQFLCARRATPMIVAAGGGAIVNMSSAAGKHGYAFRSPYSAAKFGVIGLTQSLAKELGPQNIRVNAILPGFVQGPRMDRVIDDRAAAVGVDRAAMEAEYLAKVSLRRMVRERDVAETVAFLLSPAGAVVSGQSLAVDGNVETL